MFSLEELWVKLTTEHIGFYTFRRSDQIPTCPGVYAWFLPLRLRGEPEEFLTKARLIFSYDSGSQGPARWESTEAGFRWDPLHVQISRQIRITQSTAQGNLWNVLRDAPQDVKDQFRIAAMAASIFARPLYVGLSNNLFRRYGEHVSDGSGFHKRFTRYMDSLKMHLPVRQLLFVCIPLVASGDEDKEYTDAQIRALEDTLKIICQPAFGDI